MTNKRIPEHTGVCQFRHGLPDVPECSPPSDVEVEVLREPSGFHVTVRDDGDASPYFVDTLLVNQCIEHMAVGDSFVETNVAVIVGPAKDRADGLLAYIQVV